MKGVRTLRGTVNAGDVKRLIVDDGRFNDGFIVKEFYVWARSISGSSDPECALGLDEDMSSNWDAEDNRQIGWAGQTTSASSRTMDFALLDPSHVVVTDLFINNFSAAEANYMVIIEPVHLSDDQAILALIKERAQDDID